MLKVGIYGQYYHEKLRKVSQTYILRQEMYIHKRTLNEWKQG